MKNKTPRNTLSPFYQPAMSRPLSLGASGTI